MAPRPAAGKLLGMDTTQPTSWSQAPISTILHKGVISSAPQTPLWEVAALMAHHCVHCIVIDGLAPVAMARST